MVTRSRPGAPSRMGLVIGFISMACSVDVRPLTVMAPPPPTIVLATFEAGDARPDATQTLADGSCAAGELSLDDMSIRASALGAGATPAE